MNDQITLDFLFSLDHLNEAFYLCTKESKWKESVQRYEMNLLRNNIKLRNDILSGNYKQHFNKKFEITERGKHRVIHPIQIRDKIVQKVLCKYVLIPQLSKYLIYDNYASLENRGVSIARKRIHIMLHNFMKNYGTNGYVLLIDIHKYFESIDREVLKNEISSKIVADQKVIDLINYIIDESSPDEIGVNLGSEAPQIFAIAFLSHSIDQYIKNVCSIKYYGRYVDDMIIIHQSKRYLNDLLKELEVRFHKLKLELNTKKTRIVKLSKGFTFLQTKYAFSGNRINRRPPKKKMYYEKKRLREMKGKMSMAEIHNCYKSWRNNILKNYNSCWRSLRSMDNLYGKYYGRYKKYIS